MIRSIFFFVCLAILGACNYSASDKKNFDVQIKRYITARKLPHQATGSGLYLHIDSLGKGRKIQFQDSVWVSYKLTLLNGTTIDKQTQAVGLPLNSLIKAWQEALYHLPVGSKLSCISPPQLAYGQAGTDKISKDKILYFEMTIVDAK
ncbi:MAG: FKBP-type peptidyl-prolyl cis-trans isomerase [Bacteroidota bacterium]|jgi:FKBP-type peptidyl-prolyl cis-trans isomerase